jgi:hypothetical protein
VTCYTALQRPSGAFLVSGFVLVAIVAVEGAHGIGH